MAFKKARFVYCVTYASKSAERSPGLEEELRRSAGCYQLFHSAWLVATSESAENLYARIIRHFQGGDSVVVLQVGSDYCGWLQDNGKVRRWLQRHLGGEVFPPVQEGHVASGRIPLLGAR